ncbi:hypothetical protein MNBD_PLANCTO03-797, partial [hydrothermal vent metagenome]
VEAVPMEGHDQRVDALATSTRLIAFEKKDTEG